MHTRIKRSLLIVLSLLATVPIVVAHEGGVGLPKTGCESGLDARVHEYGLATGTVAGGHVLERGQVQGTAQVVVDPNEVIENDNNDLPTIVVGTGSLDRVVDGASSRCAEAAAPLFVDGEPSLDFTLNAGGDAHYEYAAGGAWLLSSPQRAAQCWGLPADHAPRSPIFVADAASPREVVFGVYADYGPRAVPTTGDPFGGCGDFELDYGIQCVNVCTPQFEPGVDGAYYVMIPSGTGHIHTGGSVPECTDGADNDGDGRTDFPDDPGCIGPMDDAESPEVLASECSDGLDNDLDGRVDFPADPGCADTADDTESPDPACGDRVDNDGDGRIDYPADPRCADARDTSEGPDPQCDDGRDNDGDGKADYPADYGCSSLDDDSEGPNPQCSDGIDNDNHGQIDYPDDPQCDNPYDDSELEDPDCSDGVDNDGDGKTDFPNDPGCSSPSDNNETDPCGNDFLSTVSTGSTNTGAVDIYFKVGSGRTLTKERVWHSGGPSPNPNPISHTYHSGTGGGSEHDWTVGASSDYKTRQFSYEFQTYGCGVYKTYSGYFYIYN